MPAPVRTVPLFQLIESLALITAALYWTHTVFMPVALALLLTFLVNLVVTMLQRRGLRWIAVILRRPAEAFLSTPVSHGHSFVITFRYHSSCDDIVVENPYGVTLRGNAIPIARADDGGTHHVHVVLGSKIPGAPNCAVR